MIMEWVSVNMNKVKMCFIKTVVILLIFNFFGISSCRRLSLKESLTAYAEDSVNHFRNSRPSADTSRNNHTIEAPSSTLLLGSVSTPVILGHSKNGTGNSENGNRKSSLLEIITKNMLSPFQMEHNRIKTSISALNSSTSQKNRDDNNGSFSRDPVKLKYTSTKEIPQQSQQNVIKTEKNEFGDMKEKWFNKNNKSSNISKAPQKFHITKEDLEEERQQRSKKEVSSNLGLQNLLWNTATALWSVNKVHFLPTFLHTKTGGKLSLIRDSIFKPIAILSQFTNGIQEINNEKRSSLSRLAGIGTGWTRPPKSQVVVIKVQPDNAHLWTLARYVFRLTKHTVITKWRLKRALLDLQYRALRKLLRIISSKNVPQKLATVKILTNAILRGKLGLLNILAGKGHHQNSTSYPGKDNSLNVDITYSSLNNPSSSEWPNHNYEPPSSEFLPFRPNPLTASSSSPPKINYYHYEEPVLSERTPPPATTPTPEPLIESPSYANVLETMGIDPTNYHYDDFRNNRQIETTTTSTSPPPASSPTVVYYSSIEENKPTTYRPTSHIGPYKSSLIEKPAASYSFHYPNAKASNDLEASQSSSTSSLRSYLSSFPALEGSHSAYGDSKNKKEPLVKSATRVRSFGRAISPFRLKLLDAMLASLST